jgi:hypothetical protein
MYPILILCDSSYMIGIHFVYSRYKRIAVKVIILQVSHFVISETLCPCILTNIKHIEKICYIIIIRVFQSKYMYFYYSRSVEGKCHSSICASCRVVVTLNRFYLNLTLKLILLLIHTMKVNRNLISNIGH